MRRLFGKITLALLAAFALGIASPAFAQSTILVVDIQELYDQTELGQDILRQLSALEEELRSSIQANGEGLRGEMEELQRQREEFIITDEVFQQRLAELQQQDQVLRARVEISGQAMQFAQNRANEAFFAAVQPDLAAIMDERSGTALLERRSTILTAENADITGDMIARVNGRITELEIDLLPQQEAE